MAPRRQHPCVERAHKPGDNTEIVKLLLSARQKTRQRIKTENSDNGLTNKISASQVSASRNSKTSLSAKNSQGSLSKSAGAQKKRRQKNAALLGLQGLDVNKFDVHDAAKLQIECTQAAVRSYRAQHHQILLLAMAVEETRSLLSVLTSTTVIDDAGLATSASRKVMKRQKTTDELKVEKQQRADDEVFARKLLSDIAPVLEDLQTTISGLFPRDVLCEASNYRAAQEQLHDAVHKGVGDAGLVELAKNRDEAVTALLTAVQPAIPKMDDEEHVNLETRLHEQLMAAAALVGKRSPADMFASSSLELSSLATTTRGAGSLSKLAAKEIQVMLSGIPPAVQSIESDNENADGTHSAATAKSAESCAIRKAAELLRSCVFDPAKYVSAYTDDSDSVEGCMRCILVVKDACTAAKLALKASHAGDNKSRCLARAAGSRPHAPPVPYAAWFVAGHRVADEFVKRPDQGALAGSREALFRSIRQS